MAKMEISRMRMTLTASGRHAKDIDPNKVIQIGFWARKINAMNST